MNLKKKWNRNKNMNFKNFIKYKPFISSDLISCDAYDRKAAKHGWDNCKAQILLLLEQNKELESISYSGRKLYKINGSIIDKIKKEI